MNVVALTDLTTVKTWLKISETTDDTLLGNLINSVSAALMQYCNRNFASAAYTETYNGDGQPSLFLKQRPITAVSSLTVDGVTIPQQTTPGGYGWAFDLNRLYIVCGRFCEGIQNVQVSYTAGLSYSQSAFPDLWQAAAEWVGIEYKTRSHIDKVSEALGQGGQTTFLNKMPWTVQLVADRYRHSALVNALGI